MTDTRSELGSGGARRASADDGRACELRGVVIRYDGRPDRCTVYPRRDSCRERAAAWLSADLDAFVPLDARR